MALQSTSPSLNYCETPAYVAIASGLEAAVHSDGNCVRRSHGGLPLKNITNLCLCFHRLKTDTVHSPCCVCVCGCVKFMIILILINRSKTVLA